MALVPTTRDLTVAYSCLNPSNAAAAAFSFYPLGEACMFKVSASSTPTQDDDGAIIVPAGLVGGATMNTTVAELFPGSTDTFLHARSLGVRSQAVIACA